MRDNLVDDRPGLKKTGASPYRGRHQETESLPHSGIQLGAGLLLDCGNGEKPPTADVSERQS
jgi:hypothetical protein